jgi:hypothetical protein
MIRRLLRWCFDSLETKTHDFTASGDGGFAIARALREDEGGMRLASPYSPCPSCGVLSRGAHVCEKPTKKAVLSRRQELAEELQALISEIRPRRAEASTDELIRRELAPVVKLRPVVHLAPARSAAKVAQRG